MKTTKLLFRTALFFFASVSVLFVSSCKDDDDDKVPTDFLGTWVTEETITTELGDLQLRDILTFNPTSFTEVIKIYDDVNEVWIDYIGRKADIVVRQGSMDVTITEVGTTSLDDEGYPTGNITYYADGTDEFDQIISFLEMEKEYKALYTVTGSSMTLKSDDNNDGSYDEDDEVHVFTKQ